MCAPFTKLVISQNSKGYCFKIKFKNQTVAHGGYYKTYEEAENEGIFKQKVKNYYVGMSNKGVAKFNKILRAHVNKKRLRDWFRIGIRSTWRHVDIIRLTLIEEFAQTGAARLTLYYYDTTSNHNESFEFDESDFSLIFIKDNKSSGKWKGFK